MATRIGKQQANAVQGLLHVVAPLKPILTRTAVPSKTTSLPNLWQQGQLNHSLNVRQNLQHRFCLSFGQPCLERHSGDSFSATELYHLEQQHPSWHQLRHPRSKQLLKCATFCTPQRPRTSGLHNLRHNPGRDQDFGAFNPAGTSQTIKLTKTYAHPPF